MSVVEQACILIGRMSRRHRANPGKRDCGNLSQRNPSGLGTGNEVPVGVGERFGKYYLEKIANLETSASAARQ